MGETITKGFNRSMDRYITNVRRKELGLVETFSRSVNRIKRKMKKSEKPPQELSEHEVHIEEKKPGFFEMLFSGKSRKENKEMAEEIIHEPKEVREEMKQISEDYDTLNEVEKDVEKKKEGLFSKFLRLLKPKKGGSEDLPAEEVQEAIAQGTPKDQQIGELKADLKRMAEIAFDLADDLPKARQKEFKDGNDFKDYKTILEKHGLIKKK